VKHNNEFNGSEGRAVVIKAYETALQYIGMDKDAGGIWHDYIAFIKAGEVSDR
jgi:cleavage stimulation factor subunit 3